MEIAYWEASRYRCRDVRCSFRKNRYRQHNFLPWQAPVIWEYVIKILHSLVLQSNYVIFVICSVYTAVALTAYGRLNQFTWHRKNIPLSCISWPHGGALERRRRWMSDSSITWLSFSSAAHPRVTSLSNRRSTGTVWSTEIKPSLACAAGDRLVTILKNCRRNCKHSSG